MRSRPGVEHARKSGVVLTANVSAPGADKWHGPCTWGHSSTHDNSWWGVRSALWLCRRAAAAGLRPTCHPSGVSASGSAVILGRCVAHLLIFCLQEPEQEAAPGIQLLADTLHELSFTCLHTRGGSPLESRLGTRLAC